jgi:hypothetical protein
MEIAEGSGKILRVFISPRAPKVSAAAAAAAAAALAWKVAA